ncbi:MAG: single-stranded-DNA-specific exonuclease RecJ [Patescibacteria group bacterium]
MLKKWVVRPEPPAEFINSHPELPLIVARLLWNRGLKTQEQIDEFLNPDYLADIHDPFLFRDMDKATDIIFDAIAQDKKIVVHGDYDADGVCATTILTKTLKKLGAKNLSVFLPSRIDDGYGLNLKTIKSFVEQKNDLIITCDCGITNVAEVKAAKDAGLTVIISDHHTPPEIIPPADAVIHAFQPNETYPDKGLAGAAVAFKLAQGLLKKHQKNNSILTDGQTHEAFEKWLLDLVAIATIGDMVPLIGESRTLARYGLTVINKTRNIGLKQLLVVASLVDENGKPKRNSFDSETVSFQIVPRLNAAGRMDHANTAYALLASEDKTDAEKLALMLNQNNIDRQKMTEELTNRAIKQINSVDQTKNFVLFFSDEALSVGIAGLIAGKIKDTYNKPAIAIGLGGEEITGSGRSIPEFNIMEALHSMPEFFLKYGGHPQACGFSLKSRDDLEKFQSTMNEYASKTIKDVDMTPQILVDAEINLEDVDWKLYDILQKFEPFGARNEEPIYTARNLTVVEINPVGNDGKHLKLMVRHNSHTVRKTIAFGFGDINKHPLDWKKILHAGDKIDLVFTVGVNEWNGNRELELSVKDMKVSE